MCAVVMVVDFDQFMTNQRVRKTILDHLMGYNTYAMTCTNKKIPSSSLNWGNAICGAAGN